MPIKEANGTLTGGTAHRAVSRWFDERPLLRANYYDVMPDGRLLMERPKDAHPSQTIVLSLNRRDRTDTGVSVTASR